MNLRPCLGGGKGTILIGLEPDDLVEQWAGVGPTGVMFSGVYRARTKEIKLSVPELEVYKGKRARKGKILDTKIKQPTLWSMDFD